MAFWLVSKKNAALPASNPSTDWLLTPFWPEETKNISQGKEEALTKALALCIVIRLGVPPNVYFSYLVNRVNSP